MARLLKKDDRYYGGDNENGPVWCGSIDNALRFADDDPTAEQLAVELEAEVEESENTPKEEQALINRI